MREYSSVRLYFTSILKKRSLISGFTPSGDNVCLINFPRHIFSVAEMGATVEPFKISGPKFRNDIAHRNYVISRVSALTGEVFRIVIAKVDVLSDTTLLPSLLREAAIKCSSSSIIAQCFLT